MTLNDKPQAALSNIRSFGTYTPEAQAAERASLREAKAGLFWKPEDGDNIIRIFPPLDTMLSPFIIVYQHFLKLPWLERGQSFNCPRLMAKRPCAACQFVRDYSADASNRAKQNMAKEASANGRVFAVVAVRRLDHEGNPTGESVGPKLWGFSQSMHEKLLVLLNNKVKGGNFIDAAAGFDIIVTKTGEGKDTRYSDPTPMRELSPLGTNEEVAAWLENYPDLAQLTAVPTYEETLEKLGQVPNKGRSAVTVLPTLAQAQTRTPAKAFQAAPPAAAQRPVRVAGGGTIQTDIDGYDPDAE